jgi:dTDP-4-dehydrorhamnose reductase
MIWVIGNSGLLGSTFCNQLERLSIAYYGTGSKIDICKYELLEEYFSRIKPNLIINCSGFTNVETAELEQDKAYAVNVIGVENIAKLAATKKVKLVHFSTDYVFDGKKKIPYNEQDQALPLSFYGKTKLLGEQALFKKCPDSLLIRVSWLYNHNGLGFINRAIQMLYEKSKIFMVDDQVSSPTCAENLVKEIINGFIGNYLPTGIFHYQDKNFASRYEIVYFLAKTLQEIKPEAKLAEVLPGKTEQFNDLAKRPVFSAMDCTKFQKKFNCNIQTWQENIKNHIGNMP